MTAPPEKTRGEVYEGLAFTFCKAATIILITGRWALPIAAGASAVLYLLAHFNGKPDTRCILRTSIGTAAFWGTVAAAVVYLKFYPMHG